MKTNDKNIYPVFLGSEKGRIFREEMIYE